jgi:hypothetical protein
MTAVVISLGATFIAIAAFVLIVRLILSVCEPLGEDNDR